MIEDPKFTIYGSQIQEWMEDIQKLKQERNKLQEKCDKLDDNTIELKKKAEAFDEIKEYTLDKIEMLTTRQEFAPNPNDFEYFGNLLTAFKAVKYKMIDLERGNNEEI